MADRYQEIAERIIREAIEGIETLTIAEGNDDDLDDDELEKRIRDTAVHIYVPTAAGCKCLGLSHQRECPIWTTPW
jgi:hypothetical protein